MRSSSSSSMATPAPRPTTTKVLSKNSNNSNIFASFEDFVDHINLEKIKFKSLAGDKIEFSFQQQQQYKFKKSE